MALVVLGLFVLVWIISAVVKASQDPGPKRPPGNRPRPVEQHALALRARVLIADELERAVEGLDERLDVVLDLAALVPQRVDLALHVVEPALRLLQDQVALAFGVADDQAGLGLRVFLDVVGVLLRGQQRVAEVALLAAVLGEHGVELGDVLAQLVVFAQRVLVVVGDREQERLDFAAIVAAHHGLEPLLPQVEWSDFHM